MLYLGTIRGIPGKRLTLMSGTGAPPIPEPSNGAGGTINLVGCRNGTPRWRGAGGNDLAYAQAQRTRTFRL